jgi:hypothetical protein
MNSLLKSKETIFLGIILLLTLCSNRNFSYYAELNKPWFALPLIGIYFIYALAGVSIFRSFSIYVSSVEPLMLHKLKVNFIVLWLTYIVGFYLILATKLPVFFPIGVLFVLISLFIAVFQAFKFNIEIVMKLNMAIYIFVYLLVVGLYIATNNPSF